MKRKKTIQEQIQVVDKKNSEEYAKLKENGAIGFNVSFNREKIKKMADKDKTKDKAKTHLHVAKSTLAMLRVMNNRKNVKWETQPPEHY